MELTKKPQTSNDLQIPDELKDVFDVSQNTEGITPRLPQIKIIHRGQLYEMPDDTKVPSFEGIILDQHPANAWWEKDISESGGNAIPDCFSLDAITPEPNSEKLQSQKCADCPQNQFGSDKKTGKGKACKNMKRLHILMEGSSLPRRLTVPPTSIKSFESYLTNLIDRGLPYACCVSTFSLAKKVSESFEFAEIKLNLDRVLNKEELIYVAKLIKQYKEEARHQEIRADEYVADEGSEDSDIPF